MILSYYGIFWAVGVFLTDLSKILAGAPYCVLLFSLSMNSKSVAAFAAEVLLIGLPVIWTKWTKARHDLYLESREKTVASQGEDQSPPQK